MHLPANDHAKATTVMEQLIEKYSFLSADDVQSFRATSDLSDNPPFGSLIDKVILLTGTTGNLGSDLLANLLSDRTVRRVYALNRASDLGSSRDRVGEQLSEKGLPQDLLDSSKCVFIDGRLTDPKLGLRDELLEELRREVTTVIHNAWPTWHAAPLAKFEPSILGLHNLLDFTRSIPSTRQPRFIFISSCVSTHLWRVYEKHLPIPEDLVSDARVAAGFGYAESKYVGEHIVARSGLNATSLRVTQLSARRNDGAWSPTEWVPMILRIMQEVGAVPGFLTKKRYTFMPLDTAAQCICEIALSPAQRLPVILNVAHPRPFPWSTIRPMVQLILGDQQLRFLPFKSFIDRVEGDLVPNLPGSVQRQLKTYLRGMFVPGNTCFDDTSIEHFPVGVSSTARAEELSPTLKNLSPLSSKDCESWAKYWIKIGHIDPGLRTRLEAKL